MEVDAFEHASDCRGTAEPTLVISDGADGIPEYERLREKIGDPVHAPSSTDTDDLQRTQPIIDDTESN